MSVSNMQTVNLNKNDKKLIKRSLSGKNLNGSAKEHSEPKKSKF